MPKADLCSHCGAPTPRDARACRFCGTAFETTTDGVPPEQHRELMLVNYLGALAIEGKNALAGLRYALPQMLKDEPGGQKIARGVPALAEEFEKESRAKLDATAAARLFSAYCRARRELDSAERTEINLPFLISGPSGPVHFSRTLGRADLARLES